MFLSSGRVEVPVEVQFRTIAMDFWASLEHKIYYKYDRQVPQELLVSLKDAADTAAELDERMERLHRELHGPVAGRVAWSPSSESAVRPRDDLDRRSAAQPGGTSRSRGAADRMGTCLVPPTKPLPTPLSRSWTRSPWSCTRCHPEEFTDARNARAAASDRALAARVKALRKPTASAWAVDLLARDGQLAEALELAGALREAQDDLDAAELGRLSRQRRSLVSALATQAVDLARDRGVTVSAAARERRREDHQRGGDGCRGRRRRHDRAPGPPAGGQRIRRGGRFGCGRREPARRPRCPAAESRRPGRAAGPEGRREGAARGRARVG